MRKRLTALGYYTVFWLLFFVFARLFFIFYQYHDSFKFGTGELLSTFWNGAKLDISTTGYYLLIPVLFAVPGVFATGNWYKYFIRWYTFFMIGLSSVIVVSDASLYTYWGFRMDHTPLLYLKTPGEAMASVSTMKAVLFFMTIVIISAFFIFIYRKFIDKYFSGFQKVRPALFGILSDLNLSNGNLFILFSIPLLISGFAIYSVPSRNLK